MTDNLPIRIYVNEIENMIKFRIQTRYYPELLTPETMKLFWGTKRIPRIKIPHLETAEVVLVPCKVANNDYQQDSVVLYSFVPKKSFGQLLDISPTNFIFL